MHAIKFQAVSSPNGLCAHICGPYEYKKRDASMLRESALLEQLQQYSLETNGNIQLYHN